MVARSLDLPALDRVDTLAQELALLQDRGKRRIAILGSRHVPVVSVHLVELVARSLAQEGHNLITSGAQGVNAAVIRSVLEIDPSRLTVLLPQSLDRQPGESREQLERVLHLVEKPERVEGRTRVFDGSGLGALRDSPGDQPAIHLEQQIRQFFLPACLLKSL